jgi:hypothetical protein
MLRLKVNEFFSYIFSSLEGVPRYYWCTPERNSSLAFAPAIEGIAGCDAADDNDNARLVRI